VTLLSLDAPTDVVVSYRVPYWQQATLPIMAGPLSGSRWLVASGGKVLRMICGTYESAQTRLFERHVLTDSIVFDLGANVGYYTLLAAKLARRGHVVAFEPEPRNAAFLRANIAANRCRNITVRELAVAGVSGTARFKLGRGSGTGALSCEGALHVKLVSLDEFVAESGLSPTHLKIDVEGAEYEVLCGGIETLSLLRPTIFLSTHGPLPHRSCCELLQDLNYDLRPIDAPDLATAAELLCLG
jgi:FkbM family methyltransferase